MHLDWVTVWLAVCDMCRSFQLLARTRCLPVFAAIHKLAPVICVTLVPHTFPTTNSIHQQNNTLGHAPVTDGGVSKRSHGCALAPHHAACHFHPNDIQLGPVIRLESCLRALCEAQPKPTMSRVYYHFRANGYTNIPAAHRATSARLKLRHLDPSCW